MASSDAFPGQNVGHAEIRKGKKKTNAEALMISGGILMQPSEGGGRGIKRCRFPQRV
jgi:hypothetical protein